jgi:uridine kinase
MLTYLGASLSGKSTILLKLLRNIKILKYTINRVVLLYYHRSTLYDEMEVALRAHNIDFVMRRYEEVPLDIEHLSALRGGPDTTLIVCDDATSLVDGHKSFNHLIHVARHSGLLFVLLIHGPIFTRPQSRAMVGRPPIACSGSA